MYLLDLAHDMKTIRIWLMLIAINMKISDARETALCSFPGITLTTDAIGSCSLGIVH